LLFERLHNGLLRATGVALYQRLAVFQAHGEAWGFVIMGRAMYFPGLFVTLTSGVFALASVANR
jgi:hypothetical protein